MQSLLYNSLLGGGGGVVLIFLPGLKTYLLEHECTSKTNTRVYKPSTIQKIFWNGSPLYTVVTQYPADDSMAVEASQPTDRCTVTHFIFMARVFMDLLTIRRINMEYFIKQR